MGKKEFVMQTAKELYLKLPARKRRKFLKWELSNNWDVKDFFTWCIIEAEFMWSEFEKNKKHLEYDFRSNTEKNGVPCKNHVWDAEEYNPHCHRCGLLMRDDQKKI